MYLMKVNRFTTGNLFFFCISQNFLLFLNQWHVYLCSLSHVWSAVLISQHKNFWGEVTFRQKCIVPVHQLKMKCYGRRCWSKWPELMANQSNNICLTLTEDENSSVVSSSKDKIILTISSKQNIYIYVYAFNCLNKSYINNGIELYFFGLHVYLLEIKLICK